MATTKIIQPISDGFSIVDSVNGSKIDFFLTTGAPSSGTGTVGSRAFDKATKNTYFKRTSTIWEENKESIVCRLAATGLFQSNLVTYITGNTPIDGVSGFTIGDSYLDINNGNIFTHVSTAPVVVDTKTITANGTIVYVSEGTTFGSRAYVFDSGGNPKFTPVDAKAYDLANTAKVIADGAVSENISQATNIANLRTDLGLKSDLTSSNSDLASGNVIKYLGYLNTDLTAQKTIVGSNKSDFNNPDANFMSSGNVIKYLGYLKNQVSSITSGLLVRLTKQLPNDSISTMLLDSTSKLWSKWFIYTTHSDTDVEYIEITAFSPDAINVTFLPTDNIVLGTKIPGLTFTVVFQTGTLKLNVNKSAFTSNHINFYIIRMEL